MLIPKMTLQPLIENSIYHGVEPSLEKCLLIIRARLEEQRTLVLEVCDDGQGMDAQSLEVLRRQLALPEDVPMLVTSSEKREGFDALRKLITQACEG